MNSNNEKGEARDSIIIKEPEKTEEVLSGEGSPGKEIKTIRHKVNILMGIQNKL